MSNKQLDARDQKGESGQSITGTDFTGSKRALDVNALNLGGNTGPFGKFDEIIATYPNTTTENYEYRLDSTSLGNVVVVYTDESKDCLSSVNYNES